MPVGLDNQNKQNAALKAIKSLIDKVGKVAGKSQKTEQEIYKEIKLLEKRLKVAGQLQTYQTVFICQVIIPNFNMKRRRQADQFIKDTIGKTFSETL